MSSGIRIRGIARGWSSHPDPLYGRVELPPVIQRLLGAPAVRRLDRLRQLPDISFGIPSATHTRLLHSIGVMHLAGCIFDRIHQKSLVAKACWKEQGLPALDPAMKIGVQIAALLHDLGHGPFSHAFEHVCRRRFDVRYERHEHRTKRLIADTAKGANTPGVAERLPEGPFPFPLLRDPLAVFNKIGYSEAIGFMVQGQSPSPERPEYFFLGQIISSDLDADRMDFLRRDALATGIGLGFVDPWPLIDSMTLHRDSDGTVRLALPAHAETHAKALLSARARAYHELYNSPMALAAHEMLVLAFDERWPEHPDEGELALLAGATDEELLSWLGHGESLLAKDLVRRLTLDAPYMVLPVPLGDALAPLSEVGSRTLARWRAPSADDVASHRDAVHKVSKEVFGAQAEHWRCLPVIEEGSLRAVKAPRTPWILLDNKVNPIDFTPPSAGAESVPLAIPPDALLSIDSERELSGATSEVEALRLATDMVRRAKVRKLYGAWLEALDSLDGADLDSIEKATADWLLSTVWKRQ